MNNAQYWSKRQKQLIDNLEHSEGALTKKLETEYVKQLSILENEIGAYYSKYGVDGVIQYRHLILELSESERLLLYEKAEAFMTKYPEYAELMPIRESIYKLNRLEGLEQDIYIRQCEIGAITEKELSKHLLLLAEKGYKAGGGRNLLNEAAMQKIVNARWISGKNFSERVWANTNMVSEHLKSEFKNAVIRGDSYEKSIKAIRRKFGVNKSNATRLIYTEGTYVMNEASITAFEEYYEEYEYGAVMDGKTSDICRSLDGQRFKIALRRPGINFPPMHARCRSSYQIVLDPFSKNVELPQELKEAEEISEDIKEGIADSIDKIEEKYGIKIPEIEYAPYYDNKKAPFTYIPYNKKGEYKAKLNINTLFNWDENLEKLNERIYNRNYKRKILSSQNLDDLILHEAAHFETFKDCDTWASFLEKEADVRSRFISWGTQYNIVSKDGAETIAEGFVAMQNGDKVDERVQELVREYIKW